MAVKWGGRGPGHVSRLAKVAQRTWGGWNVSVGWVESPAGTFTRNTADSWTPRVYSNSEFTGPCKMEGTWISGADTALGLSTNRTSVNVYAGSYQWYLTGNATTRTSGTARFAAGAIVAGDIYGVRKSWNGSAWLIEWYRTRSGTTTVLDSLTTATDETLGVVAGAFQNGAGLTLLESSI